MKRIVILSAALIVTLASASERFVIGLGSSSCGTYTKLVAGDEDLRMTAGFYVQGYLSGVNVGMAANQRKSKHLPDAEALLSFIDSYCRRNPLERVDDGLIALYSQLK